MSGRNDELREAVARWLARYAARHHIGAALTDHFADSMWPEYAKPAEDLLALPALRATEERARVAEEARDGWREAARRDLERALRAEARVAELEAALRPAVEVLRDAEVVIDAEADVDTFNRVQATRKRAAALLPTPEAPRG